MVRCDGAMWAVPAAQATSLALIAAFSLLGCGGSRAPAASGPAVAAAAVTPGVAASGASNAPTLKPGTAAHGSACSYITRAEMADLLSAPIGPLVEEHAEGTTSCAYPSGAADSYSHADIEIEWHIGGSSSLEHQLSEAFGDSDAGQMAAHPVNLGDKAFYSREGVLSIHTGKTQVTITLAMRQDSEARAVAIGKTLLERMGVPAAPAPIDRSVSGKLPNGLTLGEECPIEVADAVSRERSAIVPLKAGLTLSSIWSPGDYDHECLEQVTAITASYIDITESCPLGTDHHNATQKRRLCQSDLRDSFFYRTETAEAKDQPPVSSPTTKFSLSSRSLHELKATGGTRHRYVEINEAGWRTRAQPMNLDIDGTLMIQDAHRQSFKVIVNNQQIELPTVVAIAFPGTSNMTTATIVDDERFPFVIDYERPAANFAIRYTKISYPNDADLERHLAVDKKVDVYGIYFDFASDRLRPESTPVLAEIAAVLAKNHDWKLNINGHTDNLGSDPSNLDLSRLRAVAVKSALVERYAIAADRLSTGGFGASQPQAKNDTPEGRARNRRVELIRQ
jgi:outer membrane protein OmpA-like peptidoglycan-associated protein